MRSIEILLRDDHSKLDELLSEVFVRLKGDDVEATYRYLDLFWARLAMHIRAEHVRLFPAVVAVVDHRTEFADVADLIDRLRHDHDFFMRELARAIKLMRAGDDDPVTAVTEILESVRERLVSHDRIEEEQIYPLALTMPTELYAEIKSELDNLPPRFEAPSDG